MIVGNELRAWTSDGERQRDALASANAFAARWTAGPLHRQFAEAMSRLRDDSAEAVVESVRALFADDRWVDGLIQALAEEMRRDPFFIPPFRHISSDIHSGLIVFEDDHVSIATGVTSLANLAIKKNVKRRSGSIAFSGQVDILKFVRADARLSFWSAPPIRDDFTAANAGRCEPAGERRIASGDILVIDGRCQSFVIEHAASNLVVLQASVKPNQAPLRVEYDFASRKYVGCSAADDSASRIQMITTLLRKLDCGQAFAAIAAFVEHPNFFVRWHIMRELLGLDVAAAMPLLQVMAARDPHAETRHAARSVLDRIEAPQPPRRRAA
ncbi:MAG: hypothetical protein ACXWU1_10795 [Allosphingosinicella sp.]